jgi:hypothetical protein
VRSITTSSARPVILNPAGQQIIDRAFRDRSRQRASYLDVADATVRTLQQTGQLATYTVPGTDPIATIRHFLAAERCHH